MQTPTKSDINLVKKLAEAIAQQAEGTKERERIWIAGAAVLIEQLLSDYASERERKRARAYLQLAQ
jgi:dihydrofolate reductase